MTNWNPQQLEAICARNKNVLVSASAGAGKTTILVERMMRLIREDRYPIDSILAMTFTEAAANEMKKRLSASLMSALESETNEDEIKYLKQQISKVQSSHISTIHSFCLSIIQDYFYVIDLDRSRAVNIMDDGASIEVQAQAEEMMMQDEYDKQDQSFLDLLWYFSTRPEDSDALLDCIHSIVNAANAQTDPRAWIASFRTMYDITNLNELPVDIRNYFFGFLQTEVLLYLEKLDNLAVSLHFDENISDDDKQALSYKTEKAKLLSDLHTRASYPELREEWIKTIRIRIAANTKNPEYASVKKSLDDQEKMLLALLYKEDDYVEQCQLMLPLIDKISSMCISYMDYFSNIKEELGVIDFNDMEHFALAILQSNDGAVSKEYIEKFNEVMVDEFQDTNPVQDAIVGLVSRHNNVFRVGDIKQSIYGFRQASPQIMKGLMDNPTTDDTIIHLGNNYRSKQMIVDFNNDLFTRLMNVETFGATYTKNDSVKTGIEEQLKNNFPIEFHTIFHRSFKEEYDLRISKNELKADYIAKQMATLYRTGNYSWKDFCVLGRGNAVKDYMKQAFDEWNIPYFIDTKSGFYESSSVQIVSSALKVLVDSRDDISIVAVLSSPLFQSSFEEISNMKLHKEKQSFFSYLTQHPIPNFEKFLLIKENLYRVSLSETISSIYEFANFYHQYTDQQERTNLDMLFDIVVDFEDKHVGGPLEFLNYMEQMKDAKTGEAIPIGSEEDVVRVMTIHQSKGLQFPVVFLFSTSKLNNMEARQTAICDANLGLGLKAIYPKVRTSVKTPQRLAIDFKRNQENIAEEMRILYVATTRAQREMYIVDCLGNDSDLHERLSLSSYYGGSGYTPWILRHFNEQNADYFKVITVDDYWPTLPLEAQSDNDVYIRGHYSFNTDVNEEFSASMIKARSSAPSYGQHNLKGMQYGTNMHTIVELIDDKNISSSAIKDVANSIQFQISDFDIERLLTLFNSPTFSSMKQNSELFYELPFMVELDEGQSFGFMDFVAIGDGEINVVDFKTDNKTSIQLVDAYSSQLDLYKKALSKMYSDHTIHGYIYSFHLNDFIKL